LELASDGAAVAVSAIDGVAGAGKTALALHAAHKLLPQFPDGQLYADFRGYSEGQEPIEPGVVLEQFLRRLGLPAEEVPVDLEERSGVFRAMLSRRRVLIVLDNVLAESQVRPLLPGAGSSFVLITSRSMLPGLELDYRLPLGVMSDAEAIELLARLIGIERATAEPEAVAHIAELCGTLPLALSIAGQLLAVHQRWSASRLADMLTDERKRLDRLAVGDRQVRAAFLVSYRHLSESEAFLFRVLGLNPGPSFGVAAATRLADTQEEDAGEILERLVLINLVIEDDANRFRMHDLLRLFAREMCYESDGEASCRDATARIMSYYYGLASFLDCCLDPRCRHELLKTQDAASRPLPSPVQAVDTFEVERSNFLAAVQVAVADKRYERVWELIERLDGPLTLLHHLDDLIAIRQTALEAAQALDTSSVQAEALGYLGMAYLEARRFEDAESNLKSALEIFQELGDRRKAAVTLGHLGTVSAQTRHFEQAITLFTEAREIDREVGDRHGQGAMSANIGNVYVEQRKFQEAIACFTDSINIFQEDGDRKGEAETASNLGSAYGQLGQFQMGVDWLTKSFELHRAVGNLHGGAMASLNLGNAYLCLETPEKAVEFYTAALEIFRQMGDRHGEAETLMNLGIAETNLGLYDQAIAHHKAALAIHRESGDRHPQAVVLNNLGRAYFMLGQFSEAVRYSEEALTIYRDTGDKDRFDETTYNLNLAKQALQASDPLESN
jgi:tetratricopeptide (TPR) repeat protein